MAITKEQVRYWIQQQADDFGGIAEDSLGTPHQDGSDGAGWRGDYGNTTLSICGGIAVAANHASSVFNVPITSMDFTHSHGLGRIPLVQAYTPAGILMPNTAIRATMQTIVITGAVGGTLVYI